MKPFSCQSFVKMVFPEFHHHFVRSKFLFGRGEKQPKVSTHPFRDPTKVLPQSFAAKEITSFLYGFTGTGNIFFPFTRFILTSLNIDRTYARKANLALAMNQQDNRRSSSQYSVCCSSDDRAFTLHYFFLGSGYFMCDWLTSGVAAKHTTHQTQPFNNQIRGPLSHVDELDHLKLMLLVYYTAMICYLIYAAARVHTGQAQTRN